MPMTASPSGTFTTPDQDESNQMDYWLAQLAAQVESKMLGQTSGARKRVHIAGNASSLGYVISCGAITATQVTARFGAWNATNILASSALGTNAITIISWE